MRKVVLLNVLLSLLLVLGCGTLIVKHDTKSLENIMGTKAMTESLLNDMKNINIKRDTAMLVKIKDKITKDAEYENAKEKNENTISQYNSLKNIFSEWMKEMEAKDKDKINRFVKKHGELILGAIDEIITTEQTKPKE